MFNDIWKLVNEPIVISDSNGIVVDCNKAYLNLYKLSEKDVIDKPFNVIFPLEDRDQALLDYKTVFDSAINDPTFDSWVKDTQGKNIFIESKIVFIEDKDSNKYLVSILRDLTEREIYKQEIEKLKNKYKLIIESSRLGIWYQDNEYNSHDANEEWFSMLGYSKKEINDSFSFFDSIIHPDDKIALNTLQKEITLKQIDTFHIDIRLKNAKGDWHWIKGVGKILDRFSNWKPKILTGIHIDINIQKLAELELNSVKAKFEFLFESIPHLLWIADKDGNITYVNKFGVDFFGKDQEYLLKNNWLEFMHQSDVPNIIEKWQNSFANKITYDNIQRMRSNDGTYKWFQVNAYLYDYNGKTNWFGISKNINEEQTTKQNLELVTNNTNVVLALFENYKLLYFTANSKRIFSTTLQLESIFSLFSRIHKDDKKDALLFYKNWKESKSLEQQTITYRYVNTDGVIQYVEVNIINHINENNDYVSIMSFKDVTTLIDIQLKLQESNEFKDKLISIISHDLTNSLGSLVGLSDILIEDIKNNETDDSDFINERINNSLHDSYQLMKNLLTWVRRKNKSISPNKTIFDINSIIKEVIKYNSIEIIDKDLIINNTISDELLIFADKDMVNTILRNIIGNAVKYSNNNKCISMSIYEINDKSITLLVRDEGEGINNKYIKNLFNKDFDKNTIATSFKKGAGLGLQLSYDLTLINGGNIWIESEENKGSSFYIKLPRK
ncbi:PAS domain-containing sensor histidine kinase [Candidatus Kapabacteria bacterium]|nr:PAS domain-containing sensor histidine kinase [Candidatus Kapabacteria bacterium]